MTKDSGVSPKLHHYTSITAVLESFVSKYGTVLVPGEKLLANLSKQDLIGLLVFYLNTWVFDPADLLLERRLQDGNPNPDGDYAVLQLLNAFPEFLGRCLSGSLEFQDSYQQFTFGMQNILKANRLVFVDNSKKEASQDHHAVASDLMYFFVRNGLSHSLFTRKVVMLARRPRGGWQEYAIDPQNALSNYAICIELAKLNSSNIAETYPKIAKSKDRRGILESRNVRLWLDADFYCRLVLVAFDIYISALSDASESDELYGNFRRFMTAGN